MKTEKVFASKLLAPGSSLNVSWEDISGRLKNFLFILLLAQLTCAEIILCICKLVYIFPYFHTSYKDFSQLQTIFHLFILMKWIQKYDVNQYLLFSTILTALPVLHSSPGILPYLIYFQSKVTANQQK